MAGHWYVRAMAVIKRVDEEHPDVDEQQLRKLIREAYPFGERRYWPYKEWLRAQREYFEHRAAQRAWLGKGS